MAAAYESSPWCPPTPINIEPQEGTKGTKAFRKVLCFCVPSCGRLTRMKLRHSRLLLAAFLLLLTVFAGTQPRSLNGPTPEKLETRCGWFSNPTPANASLYDREGEWIISVQGGYEAEGDWPDVKEWVETNVHYGYGCACARMSVDRATKRVIRIESSKGRPLSACRRDKALRKWGFK